MSLDALMGSLMLWQMTFEHFIADLTMKSFDIFMIARNVFFQSVSAVIKKI